MDSTIIFLHVVNNLSRLSTTRETNGVNINSFDVIKRQNCGKESVLLKPRVKETVTRLLSGDLNTISTCYLKPHVEKSTSKSDS